MPNIDKVLGDMAAKLGTKAEVLWPQLVAMQRWEWVILFVVSLILLTLAFFVTKFAKKKLDSSSYEDEHIGIISMIGGVAFGLISLVMILVSLCNIPNQLIYPEIGAAKELIGRSK